MPKDIKPIYFQDGVVKMVDQTLLPGQWKEREYMTYEEVARAIETMVIRGAPAIGVAAGYGIAMGAKEFAELPPNEFKAKMDEVGAVAGGEMSGHVYFAKNNRADDAVFAFSELLLLTAEELKTKRDSKVVDGLLADFLKRYVNTPEIRIPVVSDEEKERVSDAVENYYRELAADDPKRYKRRVDENGNDIDGVKIEFVEENGWALIRRSNTSPVIILRMEARTPKGLQKIEDQVIKKFVEFKTVDLNADEYVKGIMQRVK